MERKQQLKLKEVINSICSLYSTEGEKAVYLDNGWCIYSAEDSMNLESDCYIDDYPDFDDDDNEIFTTFIVENSMKLMYRDEMIQDVVISCLKQKRNITIEEIMKAIVYYEENDCFLTL